MEQATLKGRNLEYGGRTYDVGNVIGLAMVRQGIEVTFRDGSSILTQGRPEEFYALADICPWAERVPTV